VFKKEIFSKNLQKKGSKQKGLFAACRTGGLSRGENAPLESDTKSDVKVV